LIHYNPYSKQLSDKEIESGEHRKFVGSYWEEIGMLQFEYLLNAGLKPHHKILDLGCGALRGGIHFIKYLNDGKYTGVDANRSLIKAGQIELKKMNLDHKYFKLIVDENFNYQTWGNKFDYILSVSLFTHLPKLKIKECLKAVSKTISPRGKYYTTFFRHKCKSYCNFSKHTDYGIKTYDNEDPYHQTVTELREIANSINLKFEYKGKWNHPRGQEMILIRK
jgi:cyclopropane fatty-acyl-phospholipid synthase-like methyltransferase